MTSNIAAVVVTMATEYHDPSAGLSSAMLLTALELYFLAVSSHSLEKQFHWILMLDRCWLGWGSESIIETWPLLLNKVEVCFPSLKRRMEQAAQGWCGSFLVLSGARLLCHSKAWFSYWRLLLGSDACWSSGLRVLVAGLKRRRQKGKKGFLSAESVHFKHHSQKSHTILLLIAYGQSSATWGGPAARMPGNVGFYPE